MRTLLDGILAVKFEFVYSELKTEIKVGGYRGRSWVRIRISEKVRIYKGKFRD